MLGAARAGAGLGRAVNYPTHNSLLADYYDIPARPRVYAVHRYANALGQFIRARRELITPADVGLPEGTRRRTPGPRREAPRYRIQVVGVDLVGAPLGERRPLRRGRAAEIAEQQQPQKADRHPAKGKRVDKSADPGRGQPEPPGPQRARCEHPDQDLILCRRSSMSSIMMGERREREDMSMTKVTIRAARQEDSATIAELFLISSGGLAEYIWRKVAEPGEPVLEAGARRRAALRGRQRSASAPAPVRSRLR